MKIEKRKIGELNRQEVELYRLMNDAGSYVELTNYGATLVSVVIPDLNGLLGNVVLGFSGLDGYLKDDCYMGATIGRFANRISNARFRIGNEVFRLDENDGTHSNHGGFSGFNTQVFEAEVLSDEIRFNLNSPDGQGGFPGALNLSVYYRWSDRQELTIRFQGISTRETILNLTNHAYFNLSAMARSGLQQKLTMEASRIIECTNDFIPTGRIVPAGELAFSGQRIAEKMNLDSAGFKGINSYYVFEEKGVGQPACLLEDEKSGRQMKVYTSYPGIQFYTGDFLESRVPGSHGVKYQPYDGVCIECQLYPDSPNHPNFPSTLLKVGSEYNEEISYHFDLKSNHE
ncbi:aldose epimerase family protein [Sunxiuqinia dokdonensis]|uniref:aldose epimerase family protein n=1 Tax=Sunxiuqinia dokdonensis TaxID=1409788 RepID=UPI000A4ECFA9|nr:aldose epimerase family protein [Sunxiuqinia dokdonensis]